MYIVSSGMKCKFYQMFRNIVYRFTIEIGSKNHIRIMKTLEAFWLQHSKSFEREIYIYVSMPESLHCHICVLQFKLLYFYCLFKMFSEVKLSMQSIILKFTL